MTRTEPLARRRRATLAGIAASLLIAGGVAATLPGLTTPAAASSTVDLAVVIGADRPAVQPGQTLTWTATVRNDGPDTPTAPRLVVDLPTGTTLVSAPAGCTYDAGTRRVACSLDAGTLGPGASTTRAIVVTVDTGASGTLTATAGVTSSTPDTDPGDNTSSTSVPVGAGGGVWVTKQVDRSQAAPGQTVSYTLVAGNAGPGTATGVVLADTLPPGVTFATVTPTAPDTCARADRQVTCQLGSLPVGATRTVTLTATVDPITEPTGGDHQLDVTKVEAQVSVAAGQTADVTASCPAGYLATDGSARLDAVDAGTGSMADPVVLASHATADGAGWTGTVRNPTSGQFQGKVEAVCLSTSTVSGEGHRHAVVVSSPQVSRSTWSPGAHSTGLFCGPGQVAVTPGWTFESGAGRVRTSERVDRGWYLDVDVTSAARVAFEIRCLSTNLSVVAGHTHDLRFAQVGQSVSVPAGQTVRTTVSCAEGAKGIVAGWSMGPGLVSLGTDPQPKIRVFGFYNPTAGGLTARAGLLCLDVRVSPEVAVRDVTNTASVSSSSPDASGVDNAASATFRATAASGSVVTSPAARVAASGQEVRVPLETTQARRLSVSLRALDGSGAVQAGDVLARTRTTVPAGRSTLALRTLRDAVGTLRHDRLHRARIVLVSASGHRWSGVLRLR